jgi:hypothetical protein
MAQVWLQPLAGGTGVSRAPPRSGGRLKGSADGSAAALLRMPRDLFEYQP